MNGCVNHVCLLDTDGIDGVRTILAKQLNIVYDKADALPVRH